VTFDLVDGVDHVDITYVYRVKVSVRGNGKFRLSEDGAGYLNATQNMLLWNPAQKSWTVELRHLRCNGFTKKRQRSGSPHPEGRMVLLPVYFAVESPGRKRLISG
jgi:hypothetical protein